MSEPREQILAFVRSRFPGAEIRPMAGDASTRRFFRLVLPDGGTRVVMDYGTPFEEATDDIRLEAVFRAAGLPVPAILEAVPEEGCLMLEDLGDRTLEEVLLSGDPPDSSDPEALYVQAARLAASIADRGTRALERSGGAAGPCLDEERFRFEMDFFLEHYVSGLRGRAEVVEDLRPGLHRLAAEAAWTPRKVLCHRDFHSRNLMVRQDGTLAMVDFQDARWGPDSYDLASLLRDAYVEIDEGRVDRMIACYLEAVSWEEDAGVFRSRFDTVSLQRMIKALGTFGYQAGTLGRGRYLEGVPRTLHRIRAVLEHLPRYESLRGILAFR